MDGNFADIGEGATINRHHWVASMDAAVASSSYVCEGPPTVGDPTIPPDLSSTEVPLDDEGKDRCMSQGNHF